MKTTTGVGLVGAIETASYSGILWDLTVEDAHTFYVGAGPWLVHNCPQWKPPSGSFSGRSAINDAAKQFHVDRHDLGDYVEELKRGMGRRGDENVTITPNGDIVMPETGEVLGNVLDLLGG